MLATVIHTKFAAEVSINIMHTFVTMRYFIIDRKNFYQSETSINNDGKKIFSINKMNDICVKKTLLNSAINIINN